MNVIGNKWIFLSVSGVLVLASVVAVALFGLKPGIDFVGGTLWEIRASQGDIVKSDLEGFLEGDIGLSDVILTPRADGGFLIRSQEITEADHQAHLEKLRVKFGALEELRFETIGASVGVELRGKAVTAFLLVLLTISLYIAFVFRKVSYPVRSWKYGVITLLTLFHDALIPVGFFAVIGKLAHAEVDVNFIVAILVVMGFSVHDTIVVFDRIRENLRNAKAGKFEFRELVNASVNQTMARSINTSLTLVLVLVALYFFGAPSLRYFVLTILLGTIVGTYSSIFIASPILTIWRKKTAEETR